jgi:DNA-binding response OmpR family regulator
MATILIVDDEPAFCDLLKWLLKSHGHEVLIAYNGQDAIDSYMQCRPHFTLLDLRMPEMDGLEVLKKIRTVDPKAVVMILTGWGTDQLEQQARRLGATDFLSKKLSLDSIVASMERLLKPSDKTPGSAPSPAEKGAASVVPETNTILLIDNNPKTRDAFAKFLKLHGLEIHAVQDGTTALQLLGREIPQLIVLDADLMDMKGVEVLRQMRARNYAGGIVMMTATQGEGLLKETWDMSSIDILGKPVEPERLLLAIQVALVLKKN